MALNPKQQKVVDQDGHMLVVAVPGSGKTFTLVQRCLRLLSVPGETVMMVTFTRGGADEMSERLIKAGADMSRCAVNTFHSFALTQMRRAGKMSKLLTSDKPNMVDRAARAVGSDLTFEEARNAVDFYGMRLEQSPVESVPGWDVYQAYVSLLSQYRLQDFNSVARSAVYGMADSSVKPFKCTYILVDEFQDSDEVQLAWLQKHVEQGALVTTVGDDDQAIFSFCGGLGYQGMRQFQSFTGAPAFRLDMCYRCAPRILTRADNLIKFNQERVTKDLVSRKEEPGSVLLKPFLSVGGEVEACVQGVRERPTDWAILARTNLIIDEIEAALTHEKITYKRLGGGSFWDHPGITLYMGVLEYMVNTRHQHGVESFLAWQGEDEAVLSLLHEAIASQPFEFISDEVFDFSTHSTKEFRRLFKTWKQQLNRGGVVATICTELADWIKEVNPKRSEGRIAQIVAKILSEMPTEMSLKERLGKLKAKMRNSQNEDESESVLTIGTFHASKGLEWPNVWLFRCSEGVLPSEKGDVDEERRLAYVGITRAEHHLTVSYSDRPSIFVKEAWPEMDWPEDESTT